MSEESEMLPKSVEASPTLKALAPCLRSRSENLRVREPRKVSFPEEDSLLVTGYLEPANPWEYAENVNHEDLISTYKASCEKHGTCPLPRVLDQLQTIDVDAVRNDCLDLKGETLFAERCETLEEVLKRVQFKNINLEATSLDDEGSVALFDMVEYYESATHLNISCNNNIGVRGWQACSRMIKRTRCLEELEARNVTLNEQFMPILSRALRIGTQLQVLKLENCNLSGRPIIILVAALKLNMGLRELYLSDNDLGVVDAIQLGGLLRSNFTLQLLDISNNNIQDTGLGHISDGLTEQTPGQSGNGLSILVLWNNHLTRNASKHFARAVARSQSLEMLNIGHNNLTNECLHVIKDSLQQNRTLLQLGMQSTHLTCEGAIALAECIADNPVIQRIDLRDNCLKVAGLMALALSLKVNTSITQLDLDNVPKKKMEDNNTLDQYLALVAEIREYCSRNEVAAREEEDIVEEGPATGTPGRGRVTNSTSRKISLTCETLLRSTAVPQQPVVPDNGLLMEPRRGSGGRLRSPAPSPIPSPVSSPIPSPSRTRFQVSRVADSTFFVNSGQSGSPSSSSSSPVTPPSLSSPSCFFPSTTNTRFRVTLVESSTPLPIVTSPSGNVTFGFTYKKDGDDSTSEARSEVPSTQGTEVQAVNSFTAETASGNAVNSFSAETASGNAVNSSTVVSQQVSLVTEQAPLSQNVKVTVKLDPSSDSLIIENDSSPSVASDTSEDTVDMEVRTILNPYSAEDSSLVSCDVQESREVLIGPDRDVPTWFPFPDVSNKDAFVVQLDAEKNTCVTERSSEDSTEQNSVISTMKLDRQVRNSLESLKSVEVVDNGLRTVKPGGEDDNSWSTLKLDEWIGDNGVRTKKQDEQIDSCSSIMKSDQQMDHSSEHVIQSLESNVKQAGQIENNVKQMPPHRMRKIAWVAPSEPVELKAPSNLERLLGLFHSPGSFFNKTQQQQKAVAATVNPQPVANSNTSLLSAGPLGSISDGGSGLLTSGSESSPVHVGGTAIIEVKSSVNSSPGVLRKERRTSDCKKPIPDIINNINRVQQVMVEGDRDENRSSGQCEEASKLNTRHCEDENYSVSKPYESVSECSEGDCPKSVFEAVTGGNADVETVAGVGGVCDSSHLNSRGTQNSDTLEKVDIGTHLESLNLADSSDVIVTMSQCTAKVSGAELSMESSAIRNSPTNGINFKPAPCWKRDGDQFSDDFRNGSPVAGGLPNDKSWSRSCDSSLVSVQNAAATMRLVGGASGFSSCEMDVQRGTGASSMLVSDQNADASLQPAGKDMEIVQAIELHSSNTLWNASTQHGNLHSFNVLLEEASKQLTLNE